MVSDCKSEGLWFEPHLHQIHFFFIKSSPLLVRNYFADWSAKKFLTNWSEISGIIISGKMQSSTINKCNFCMGDLGGYGIADQPPAGPHFRPRALRALGRNRGPLGGWSAIPYPPTSPMQKLPISPRRGTRNQNLLS